MKSRFPRRAFLAGIAAVGGAYATSAFSGEKQNHRPGTSQRQTTDRVQSPFRIAVINDEISEDFDRACHVAARDFGMEWIEVRGMWNKNIVSLDSKEAAEARRILDKYKLRVTDITSPLFKTDWPGAPKSKFSPAKPEFNADFSFAQQDEVLERALELAKQFGTDRVRCFDFWRLADQAPYRAAMNDKLREAAMKAGKKEITLVLENELSCNTATGAEAAKVLSMVKSRWLMLNWDPGNAAARGEKPYPDGYNLLPKDRIGHCHCKDVVMKSGGVDYDWARMGSGIVDWLGQFRALKRDGYRYAVSLETHWDGAGTPEESTRQSWAGMKHLLQEAGAL
ncbi:MAG TPA: sugar phosphate isomerase/epimerase family protein [Terriglobia bacterium]|nr:sugar phosphate isomerase/epimerase family protein [Terriglobia bacterium]